MEISLTMKTLNWNILVLEFYPWLMLAQIPTEVSFSSLPLKLRGWITAMWFSEVLLKEWMLLKRYLKICFLNLREVSLLLAVSCLIFDFYSADWNIRVSKREDIEEDRGRKLRATIIIDGRRNWFINN